MSCEQDAELAGGSGVHQVKTFVPYHREVNQGKSDLVDPTKIYPLGSSAILKHKATVASDRNQTRGVLLV